MVQIANLSVLSPGKGILDIFRILIFWTFFLAEGLRTLAPHLSSVPRLYLTFVDWLAGGIGLSGGREDVGAAGLAGEHNANLSLSQVAKEEAYQAKRDSN